MVHGRACSPNPARDSRGWLIRFWGKVLIRGEPRHRFLRVITLDDGKTIHNLVITGPGVDKSTKNLDAGAQGSVQVKLKAGTYELYCSIPGHKEAGMDAKLQVS